MERGGGGYQDDVCHLQPRQQAHTTMPHNVDDDDDHNDGHNINYDHEVYDNDYDDQVQVETREAQEAALLDLYNAGLKLMIENKKPAARLV